MSVALSPPGPWFVAAVDEGPVRLFAADGVHVLHGEHEFRKYLHAEEPRR